MKRLFICCMIVAAFLVGCVVKHGDTQKLRDLDYTILNAVDAPQELQDMIRNEEEYPFRLFYEDQGILYIAEGYGEQPTTGYSVEVREVYETEDAIRVRTSLLGPEKGEEIKEIPTYPCVVIQLEYIRKDVLFD